MYPLNNLVPSLSPFRKASVNYLDFTLAQETYDPNGEEYFGKDSDPTLFFQIKIQPD